jgi:hypothetical protein
MNSLTSYQQDDYLFRKDRGSYVPYHIVYKQFRRYFVHPKLCLTMIRSYNIIRLQLITNSQEIEP